MFDPNNFGTSNTLAALENPAGMQYAQAPGMFSKALSGVGNMFQQKPEVMAMTLDQVGSRLAPGNAFSGVGTALGKSSLANKAEQERTGQQQSIMKLLGALTGKGQAGGDKVTFTVDDNGNFVVNTGMTIPKVGSQGVKTPEAAVNATAQTAQEDPAVVMQRLQERALGQGGGM